MARILAGQAPASDLLGGCCNNALQMSLRQRLHKCILQYYIHVYYLLKNILACCGYSLTSPFFLSLFEHKHCDNAATNSNSENTTFQVGEQKIAWQRQIWRVRGAIKGCNIFLGQKLANTSSFVTGCIIMQQEKISREHSWMNPLNTLQEVIHYFFIKFFIYCFSLWYEFFVHYALTVKKLST